MKAVILYMEAVKLTHLSKWIYGGSQKLPLSQNRFTKAGLLRGPSPKMVTIFKGVILMWPASVNRAQPIIHPKAHLSPFTLLEYINEMKP